MFFIDFCRRKDNSPPSPDVGAHNIPPKRCIEHAVCCSVAAEGSAVRTGDHGANCFGSELNEPPRTNFRRKFTSAVVPYCFFTSELRGGLQRNQGGSFAASLRSFFSQKKEQLLVLVGVGEKLPQSACAASPLTPAAYSATRQSKHSSVAVEGGAV